jgi:hypothetical protein
VGEIFQSEVWPIIKNKEFQDVQVKKYPIACDNSPDSAGKLQPRKKDRFTIPRQTALGGHFEA